jgi:hypothetical protein
MSRRYFSFRAVVISSILGLALSMLSLATVLADGVGGTYPR